MITKTTSLPATVTGDATLIRPKFSSGLLLQDDDLTQSINYMHNMNRLLFKSMLGCGVLCGFKVTDSIVCTDHLHIEVEKGVALDCQGDLIELPNLEAIEYEPSCGVALPEEVWIVICHKERDCAPRDVLCSAQDGEVAPVYTRTREGYQIKVIGGSTGGTQPTGCCGCDSTTVTTATGTETKSCCDYIATPENQCYESHYHGDCACDCACDCIVLAKVDLTQSSEEKGMFVVDHSVRRFIRPVLMKDPLLPKSTVTTAAGGGVTSGATNKSSKVKKEG
jgi:hypothetical protein